MHASSAVNLRVGGLIPIDELVANFPVSTDLYRPHAHAKLNHGQHSATILKTRPIYAPNTVFGIFGMCFSNGTLGAASLWLDRPGFGRFDIRENESMFLTRAEVGKIQHAG